MIDAALIAKKLAFIETCLRELETLVRPEEIIGDLRAERFAEHTLQIAIQAAQDVASHVVSAKRLGEPRTNRGLFRALGAAGWLSATEVEVLSRMIGFRNLLVHGYTAVDPAAVKDVVENHLDDLRRFIDAVRERIAVSGQ